MPDALKPEGNVAKTIKEHVLIREASHRPAFLEHLGCV